MIYSSGWWNGKEKIFSCLRKTTTYGTFIESGYMLKITRGKENGNGN
jgi:hypothetical protein